MDSTKISVTVNVFGQVEARLERTIEGKGDFQYTWYGNDAPLWALRFAQNWQPLEVTYQQSAEPKIV